MVHKVLQISKSYHGIILQSVGDRKFSSLLKFVSAQTPVQDLAETASVLWAIAWAGIPIQHIGID